MLRTCVLSLALGSALVMAMPALATPASDIATQVAAALQGMVGKQPDSDFTITSITAEGETLVLKVDGPKAWRAGRTSEQISGAFLGGYCSKAAETFKTGMKLRVDTTEEGGSQLWTGPTIDHCPKT